MELICPECDRLVEVDAEAVKRELAMRPASYRKIIECGGCNRHQWALGLRPRRQSPTFVPTRAQKSNINYLPSSSNLSADNRNTGCNV